MKEIKEECLKDPENKLWSKETEDILEIREIWNSIKTLTYKDTPDYCYIRGRLKQIFERSQYIPKANPYSFERFDDQFMRQRIEIPSYNTPNIISKTEVNMVKPLNYYGENFQTKMHYSYGQTKNCCDQHPSACMCKPGCTSKNYTNVINQNYAIAMPPPAAIPSTIPPQTLPKVPLPEYERAEQNLNVSVNQISRLPYQIVVPPPTDLNQVQIDRFLGNNEHINFIAEPRYLHCHNKYDFIFSRNYRLFYSVS